MFTLLTLASAALLVPTLVAPAPRLECQLDRLRYISADERALDRFTAATYDYVAYGHHGAVFNEEAAAIFRFHLRIARWLHRYHATDTIADRARLAHRHHGAAGAPRFLEEVLPELPEELAYRLAGPHLLLIDRQTHAIVDLLANAFEEGW
jgi:hypothetical protein